MKYKNDHLFIRLFIAMGLGLLLLFISTETLAVPMVLRVPPLCDHTPTELRCVQLVRVIDGDTIIVNITDLHPITGENIGIRLAGVDTPEMRGKTKCEKMKARMAKAEVEIALKDAKFISLRNVERGKYFRIVADIEIDGVLLKNRLFKKNLAYPYDGGTKRNVDWCKGPTK